MSNEKLQWHPAFCSALRIELAEAADSITFMEEKLLSKKPMQVDVLAIKNLDERIRKNIGCIFREYNIIEYKSPTDYLSINDFYKVFGYACFFQSDTEHVMDIHPNEITITFADSHFPVTMVNHICSTYGFGVEQFDEGIYYITGAWFPIQIIVIPRLSEKENYWLHNLRDDLKSGGEIRMLLERYEPHKDSGLYQSVMDVIMRANWKEVEVEKAMCDALKELFADELEESWGKGKLVEFQNGKANEIRIIRRKLEKGLTAGEIAGLLELEADYISQIEALIEAYPEESDVEIAGRYFKLSQL